MKKFLSNNRMIEVGKTYLLGTIYDGRYPTDELLDSGSVAIDEEVVVDFEIVGEKKGLNTLIKVTDIF